jgi:hypothetical protein
MHVGLLPLMSQPPNCPGLNGSQFVRVSWLPSSHLQQRESIRERDAQDKEETPKSRRAASGSGMNLQSLS